MHRKKHLHGSGSDSPDRQNEKKFITGNELITVIYFMDNRQHFIAKGGKHEFYRNPAETLHFIRIVSL